MGEPHRQRGVQVGGDAGVGPGPGERGADGGVERRDHHLRGHSPRVGVDAFGRVAGVLGGQLGGGDGDRAFAAVQQVHRAVGQRAVGQQGGAARGRDVQDAVDDVVDAAGGRRGQPGVVDPLQGVEVRLRVGQRGHADAVGQRAQPVQPSGGRGLAGAGMRRGAGQLRGAVGRIGHHVARGHGVDSDQQVGVDGQAQRVTHGPVGVDVVAGGDLGRRQQDVEAAAGGQRGGQVVVDEAHGDRPAGHPGGQPGPVGQWPQHGDQHRLGGVGRDGRIEVAGLVRGHPDHRQQEPGVVQPRRGAVVGCSVGVDQHRVDSRFLDAHRWRGERAQRRREGEADLLPAPQLGGDREEVRRRLVLVGAAVQGGPQARRRGDRPGVLEPHHHVAHRAVTDVGDRAGDGDDGRAGGGDDVGGHLVDADPDEGCHPGFAGGGGRQQGGDGSGEDRERGDDADDRGEAHEPGPAQLRRGHDSGP
ncbi:hypothetical protein BN971_02038 [Mycobacterium bohemicum DSM 44277]|uniref:Uncharacterized protein n=1 Tax=Mycobacterium bohemicum DSM 44277 TaxID=1236609 RepID=A0A0U0W645_MYCBE|nr:hypothetical protein BN971_02038 [Mycobacterium bohemicum DSM 44277]